IAARIVRGRVVAETIGECFNQCRTTTVASSRERFGNGMAHGYDIVSVDLHAGDARRDGLLGESPGGRLALDRNRDSPTIIDDNKDCGQGPCTGDVDTFIERPFRSAPVPDVSDGTALLAFDLHRHRDAGAVKHLRCNRDTPGEILSRGGEIAAALVATPIKQDARHLYAAPDLRAELAVDGSKHVVRLHRRRYADVGGLMSEAGGVCTELPGALQIDGLGVEAPDEDHEAVHLQQLAGVRGERRRAGSEVALRIEELAVLDLELGNRLQLIPPGTPALGAKAFRVPRERRGLYIRDGVAPFW